MKISLCLNTDGDYIYLIAKNEKNCEVGRLSARLNDGYERFKDLCNGNKCAYIYRIETSYSMLGNGIATSLIQKLLDTYKEYNFYLCAIPSKRGDKDMGYEQLKKFYNKFGFVRTQELTPTMFRKSTKI